MERIGHECVPSVGRYVRGAERNSRCVGKGSLELFLKWPVTQLKRLNQLVAVRRPWRLPLA